MTLDLFAPKKHAPTLHHGDCLAVLRTMPDASVDAVVTDPPYLIDFMGKGWDSADGIAGKPEVWAECLRVLKPGGHLLAFGATRTYHRMACAIEDAGFEIRDSIHWMYGSGFPKSLDVSKAMDKAGGASPEQTAKWLRISREARGLSREQVALHIGCTEASVRDWEEGRARAKGAPLEFMVPSEAYRVKLEELFSYPTDGREIVGTGSDRREDGTVYAVGHSGVLRSGGNTDLAKQWQGFGTALKPAHEPVVVARKPLAGTVAANVERYGTGALNIDASRVESHARPLVKGVDKPRNFSGAFRQGSCATGTTDLGRWPPNIVLSHTEDCTESACDETCAVAELDRQSGVSVSKAAARGGSSPNPMSWGTSRTDGDVVKGHTDSGGASRFFPVFRYQAKASRSEREAGCDGLPAKTGAEAVDREEGSAGTQSPRAGAGRTATEVRNHHPTVKPIALMEWLVTLVTPPGGVVLDPFMGSGTTGVAAVRKGFRFVGIEREDEYLAIARARIEAA